MDGDRDLSSLNTAMNNLTVEGSTSHKSALPTIRINDVEYDLTKPLPNKRGKTSWIWNYGIRLSNPEGKLWMCQVCHDAGDQVTYSIRMTSHARRHLEDSHELFEHSSDTDNISEGGSSHSRSVSPIRLEFDFTKFKEAFLLWFCMAHVSFS